MALRLSSRKKIDNNNFKLEIGTTNKNVPRVIYVEGKGYISPNLIKDDYTQDIALIKSSFRNIIRTNISSLKNFDDRFIVDFQIASKGIAYNKKSYINFQFLVKQKYNPLLQLKDIKKIIESPVQNIIDNLSQTIINRQFSISKTKS